MVKPNEPQNRQCQNGQILVNVMWENSSSTESIDSSAKKLSEHSDEIVIEPQSQIPSAKGSTEASLPPGTFSQTIRKRSWDSNFEFGMSCMMATVGISEIITLPRMILKYGGASFFLPYTLALIFVGRPLYTLDLALGQFTGRGSVGQFMSISLVWKGVGITQCLICIAVSTYYSHILSITLYYCYISVVFGLQWTKCDPLWADCRELKVGSMNDTSYINTSSVLFYERNILATRELMGITIPNPAVCLSLFFVWLTAFAITAWGIRSIGKVASIISLVSAGLLLMLFLEAGRKPGAVLGMFLFVRPDWKVLLSIEIWRDALHVVSFSLGLGNGILAANSSHSSFHYDIVGLAYSICVFSTVTSVIAGLTFCSLLGCLSEKLKVSLDYFRVAKDSILYSSCADGMLCFENRASAYAALFFFNAFLMGVGSLVSFLYVSVANMVEYHPKWKDWQVAGSLSFAGFIVSLVYTTSFGPDLTDWMNYYIGYVVTSIIIFLQIVLLCYYYGFQNFCWDIEVLTKSSIGAFWRWSWAIFSPAFLVFILTSRFLTTKNFTLFGSYSILAGFGFSLLLLSPIPLYFVYYVYKMKRTKFGWREAFSTDQFLPRTTSDSREVEYFRNRKWERYNFKHSSAFARFGHALFGSTGKQTVEKNSVEST